MVTDRDLLLMSEEEHKAFRESEKIKFREKKKQLRTKIVARKETISKVKKLRRGLVKKFSKSFSRIGKAIRKRKKIRTMRITIQKKKKIVRVSTLEKRQEEKSVFFK